MLGETFAQTKTTEINFKQLFGKRDNATELNLIEVTVHPESMPEFFKNVHQRSLPLKKRISQTYAESKRRRLSNERQHQRSLRKKNRKRKSNQIYSSYQTKKLKICLETFRDGSVLCFFFEKLITTKSRCYYVLTLNLSLLKFQAAYFVLQDV